MFCLSNGAKSIYSLLWIPHRCFPLHILTNGWWGKTAWPKFKISGFCRWKGFLTLWIHVDRHTWWASKFLQSQKFLSGSLVLTSPSLHIKHSDVSIEEEEIEVMKGSTQNQRLIPICVRIYIRCSPKSTATFFLMQHYTQTTQIPWELHIYLVPTGNMAKSIQGLNVIAAVWQYRRENEQRTLMKAGSHLFFSDAPPNQHKTFLAEKIYFYQCISVAEQNIIHL